MTSARTVRGAQGAPGSATGRFARLAPGAASRRRPGWLVAASAVAVTLLAAAPVSAGSDLDVFTAGASVQPNVLIIFDNSGSMNDPIPYQAGTTYTPATFTSGTTYSRCRNWNSQCECTSANSVPPNSNWKTQSQEGSNGFLSRCGFVDANNDGQDDRSSNSYYVKTGNRLNYEPNPGASKLSVAKTAVDALLADSANDGIRFGLMVLNGSVLPSTSCYGNETAYHNDKSVLKAAVGISHSSLRTLVAGLNADSGTPLANRLIAAARYFKHDGYFTAADPVQYACQRNFVVMMTDGRPQVEGNAIVADADGEFDYIEDWLGNPHDYDGDGRDPDAAHGQPQPAFCTFYTVCGRTNGYVDEDPCEYVNGGSDYLDDVSKKIYDTDLRSDMSGKQTLATYTIGFTVANGLLERTADDGGGEYFTANSASELDTAFKEALKSIVANTESFVSPVVPVSQTTRTQSGDEVYMGLFHPHDATQRWEGNLKKYKIDANGNLIDAAGKLATDSDGNLLATAKSYWDTAASGSTVEKGGVGALLVARTAPRNIYTNISCSTATSPPPATSSLPPTGS